MNAVQDSSISARPGSREVERELEPHRAELTGVLLPDARLGVRGGGRRAGDVHPRVAAYDRFEGRSSLRSWLYRIATNVCLDMLTAASAAPGRWISVRPRARSGEPGHLSEATWIQPVPDELWSPRATRPTSRSRARDPARVRRRAPAPPPRQRASLILRDVLRWQATEVAELLDTTVASVNSALQRARATLADHDLDPRRSAPAARQGRHGAARALREAFERYDMDGAD